MATKAQFMDMLAGFSDDAEIIIEMIPTYRVNAKEPVKEPVNSAEPVVEAEAPVEEVKE